MTFPATALLRREIFATLRDYRVFLSAAITLGVLSTAVYNSWPEATRTLSDMTYLSGEFLMMLGWVLGIASFVFVPVFAVNNIAQEYRQDTLDIVRMTMVSPAGAVAAKVLNATGYFLLLIIATLPVLGAVFFLVGIEPWVVFSLVGGMLLFATNLGAAATYVSLALASSIRSLLVTYLLVGIINLFVLPIVGQIFLVPIMMGSTNVFLGFNAVSIGLAGGAFSSLFSTFIFFLLACQAWRRPRHSKMPVPTGSPVKTRAEIRRRRFSFPFYIIDPMREKPPIPDWANPMLLKEMRWGMMNRATILARVFYITTLLYFLIGAGIFFDGGYARGGSYNETWVFWYMLQCILPILVAPVLLATAFNQEKEMGNLDSLRLTLQRPWTIIWGKFVAGLQAISPFFLASITCLIVLVCMGYRPNIAPVALTLLTLLVCCGACFAVSLVVSLLTAHSSASIALSYLLGPLLLFAWPLLPSLFFNHADYWGYIPLYRLGDALQKMGPASIADLLIVNLAYAVGTAALLAFGVLYFNQRYLRDN